jgi:signal transduction histidine kinase
MGSKRADGREQVLARVVAASRVGREVADLDQLARVVGEGLGAVSCRIAVLADQEPGPWHSWRRPGGGRPRRSPLSDAGPEIEPGPGEDKQFEVHFAGELVGFVGLGARPWSPGRNRLQRDVLAVLGPVLSGARLAGALQARYEEAVDHAGAIAGARRRAVAEMDAQRRLLERDLHDGAQHHLVSLRLTIGLLEHQLRTGAPVEELQDRLSALGAQLRRTDEVLRRTAAGILPVALVTEGLVPALRSELGDQGDVRLDIAPGVRDRRYPAAVESVAYFACLEGVNNARRHAAGATITVSLHDEYAGLGFRIRDDGPGFDQARVPGAGTGLGHLQDRVGGVGGRITIRSAPGRGTVLEGLVPI